ncbi:MAG TPA: methyltransferase domain-containing protein [Ktedonobacterales bacterium]|nr:methyltransferase domain-containing protein [Ktedonobacterales bacterium]
MQNQAGGVTAKMTIGSAAVQGPLWGARAHDWSTLQESTFLPIYNAVLQRTGVGPGVGVLDVGCGAGLFLQQAARLGARVTGLDAAQPLLDIAADRTPEGRFLQGDIEQLPFDDHIFDIVTGFNSFQYAANRAHALAEARRVTRPGAPVVVAIWGSEEDCEAAGYIYALGRQLPPPPPGAPAAPSPFALSVPGALRALVESVGLTAGEEADVACPWVFPDEETALRALTSSGQAVRSINATGESAVRAAILEAIAPYRTADGGYVLRNTFRYLVASA